MRARFLAVAFVSAAALIGASAFATGANAASSGSASAKGFTSSLASTHHGTATGSSTPAKKKKGKCKTKFGTELPTVDGIISWGGGGFNDAGAADFTCHKATKIKKVEAYGYFGDPSGTDAFNVNIYANDPADGTNEPDDADPAVCSFAGVPGASNGQYPTHVLTVLTLPGGCSVGAGQYWVSLQNTSATNPWYWEMVVSQQGDAPDWRDVPNSFGSGCTTYTGNHDGTNGGDEYLVNCLGYTYGDWDFMLK